MFILVDHTLSQSVNVIAAATSEHGCCGRRFSFSGKMDLIEVKVELTDQVLLVCFQAWIFMEYIK